MIVEIRVKREDRKRAEALLELAGIKVYKHRGRPQPTSTITIPIADAPGERNV
jgi:hypothetical protein